jgi:uncharacterized protein with ParB-like and HNH nuclease domain
MEKKSSQEALTTIENLIDNYHPIFKQHSDPNVAEFFEQLTSVINTNNVLILKTIKELLPLQFFVDDYQRGYKWREPQVEELINDVNDFQPDGDAFYCLQPVVVKYHAGEKEGERGKWELIDGQQRMTTIFIILKYLQQHGAFSIDYQTRSSSAVFLREHLTDTLAFDGWGAYLKEDKNKIFNNVDNFHFFEAFHTVNGWFEGKSTDEKKDWLTKLLNHTKVIWYAAPDTESDFDKKNSIEIFMRINSGKIPLTNAELIKALFLHHVVDSEDTQLTNLQQLELAQQWDMIEHKLQDDNFWFFLKGRRLSSNSATRIEMLFDLLSNKTGLSAKQNPLYSFQYFNNLIKEATDKKAIVNSHWSKIKECFYRLIEWYENDKLYHLVGFLLTRDLKSIPDLWLLSNDKTKSLFITELEGLIGLVLKQYFFDNNMESLSIDNLEYGSHNLQITNVLILHNICAHSSTNTRLSFRDYANVEWSLEHIQAQNSKPLSSQQQWITWYEQQLLLLNSEEIPESSKQELMVLLQKTDDLKKLGNGEYEATLEKYLKQFNHLLGEIEEGEMHYLDNLALLARGDNSSVGNDIFSDKRQRIVELDRRGSFIPLATKYVFSKYYSDKVSQMYQWSAGDRNGYRKELIRCLSSYPGMESLA